MVMWEEWQKRDYQRRNWMKERREAEDMVVWSTKNMILKIIPERWFFKYCDDDDGMSLQLNLGLHLHNAVLVTITIPHKISPSLILAFTLLIRRQVIYLSSVGLFLIRSFNDILIYFFSVDHDITKRHYDISGVL